MAGVREAAALARRWNGPHAPAWHAALADHAHGSCDRFARRFGLRILYTRDICPRHTLACIDCDVVMCVHSVQPTAERTKRVLSAGSRRVLKYISVASSLWGRGLVAKRLALDNADATDYSLHRRWPVRTLRRVFTALSSFFVCERELDLHLGYDDDARAPHGRDDGTRAACALPVAALRGQHGGKRRP